MAGRGECLCSTAVDVLCWCVQNKKLQIANKDDARAKVEGFALQLFDNADTEDRAGNATMQTALAFKACVELMDACQQFGELASDVRCCCCNSLFDVRCSDWREAKVRRVENDGHFQGAEGGQEAQAGTR